MSLKFNIVHFWHLVHVTREMYKMEEVIAVDAPTPKRRRLTDYFVKLPLNTEAQKFPDLHHGRLPLLICHCHCRSRAGRQKIFRHAASSLPCRRDSPRIAVSTRKEDIWHALERSTATVALQTEDHMLCIQLFGTLDFR